MKAIRNEKHIPATDLFALHHSDQLEKLCSLASSLSLQISELGRTSNYFPFARELGDSTTQDNAPNSQRVLPLSTAGSRQSYTVRMTKHII